MSPQKLDEKQFLRRKLKCDNMIIIYFIIHLDYSIILQFSYSSVFLT